ncbi:MAG: ABC transporter ATP-binding protein [Candidatus Sericytochromatia bacterium]|nr:ABC transporter ATP-binding protein [Candidatus Tanganyikabacteria bacterium]
MAAAVELRGITKIYPGVVANDNVDLTLQWGQIHALLGENGAGKSTIMNVLYGMTRPDAGTIKVADKVVEIPTPSHAIRLGIGMVHQHFQLVGPLTVAQNVLLGCEPRKGPFFAEAKANRTVAELADRVGLPIDPAARVEQLPVGMQQRVEILKVLQRDARILIFDEPTAVLTPQEIDELGRVMQRLAGEGRALVFITHKMREVMAIATHITVMRGGRWVGETTPDKTDTQQLAAMVVGHALKPVPDEPAAKGGDVVLAVENVTADNDRGLPALEGVSLEVRAGEIVGLIGVEGNGQTELVEVITGLRPAKAGRVRLGPKDLTTLSPRARREAGVGHVAEDRLRRAVIKSFSIADNLVLDRYYRPPFCKAGTLDHAAISANGEEQVKRYRIKAPDARTSVGALSGGNQQKVVVARELDARNKALVISQPTRGVDAGAAEFIYDQMRDLKAKGAAIFLVTNELDELMALSDRLAVIYHGKIVAWRERGTITREELGKLMIGGRGTGELPSRDAPPGSAAGWPSPPGGTE